MRASDFENWLESAISEVLESMCFTATFGEAEGLENEPDWVYAKLHFKGTPSGSFGIGAPLETARVIASNFLGEEESEMDRAQATEVICELANMTCGTLLARMESRRTFDLTSPKSDERTEPVAEDADRIARTFALDEGLVYAWLEIKECR